MTQLIKYSCILAFLLANFSSLVFAEHDAQGFFQENDAETIFDYDRSKKKKTEKEEDSDFEYPFSNKDMQKQIVEAQRKAIDMIDFHQKEEETEKKPSGMNISNIFENTEDVE